MMGDNVNDNAWRFNYIVLQDPEVEEVPMFSEQNQDGSEMLDVRGKNKARYMASLVARGWAGAVLE